MSSARRPGFRLLFLCLASVGIGQSMLFSILPPAAREIGISPFQVSTVFATSAFLWVFVSPWWGRRSDVSGRRRIILIGLLGYALSMTLVATTLQIGLWGLLPAIAIYPLLIASRCTFALFGSGTGPAAQAYIADRTTRDERTAGVAMVNAGMGLGETIGPGVGALLATVGLLAPLYFSAALAVAGAWAIWRFLPEEGRPPQVEERRGPRLRARDPRVVPFILVGTALQAVRATTVITLGFLLQDTLGLGPRETVQYSGIGFVLLAVSGLFTQLVLVQNLRPGSRAMIRAGAALMLAAFLLFCAGVSFAAYAAGLSLLGMGLGFLRPGAAAGASLAVGPDEQGSVAGLLGGVAVIGNVVGPMVGTQLYQLAPVGPYVMNAAVMAAVLLYAFASPRLRRLG
jgi:MFS family permease